MSISSMSVCCWLCLPAAAQGLLSFLCLAWNRAVDKPSPALWRHGVAVPVPSRAINVLRGLLLKEIPFGL